MTIFGKILIAAMLITAGVLIVRGYVKPSTEIAMNSNSTEDQSSMTSSTLASDLQASTTLSEENTDFNGSMQDLITRGGNYKCTFDEQNDVSHSTGTVFISDKNIRGDFDTSVKVLSSDTTISSHMISDGEFIYTWSALMPSGVKLAVDNNVSSTASTTAQSFDYNQKLDYNCVAWTVDQSKFTLPTEVEFKEINQ